MKEKIILITVIGGAIALAAWLGMAYGHTNAFEDDKMESSSGQLAPLQLEEVSS